MMPPAPIRTTPPPTAQWENASLVITTIEEILKGKSPIFTQQKRKSVFPQLLRLKMKYRKSSRWPQ